MTNEQIEKFLSQKDKGRSPVKINFKSRNPIVGLFIETTDRSELQSKNLWRIVAELHIEEYKKTKDETLARIFNGTEFTKLGLTQ